MPQSECLSSFFCPDMDEFSSLKAPSTTRGPTTFGFWQGWVMLDWRLMTRGLDPRAALRTRRPSIHSARGDGRALTQSPIRRQTGRTGSRRAPLNDWHYPQHAETLLSATSRMAPSGERRSQSRACPRETQPTSASQQVGRANKSPPRRGRAATLLKMNFVRRLLQMASKVKILKEHVTEPQTRNSTDKK